jgi:hypothetical protein
MEGRKKKKDVKIKRPAFFAFIVDTMTSSSAAMVQQDARFRLAEEHQNIL